MPDLTRRELLELAAAALAGVALAAAALAGVALAAAGCGGEEAPQAPPQNSRRSQSPAPPGAKDAREPPLLSVARGADAAAITTAAIAGLGGLKRFVRRGDDVVVKPNICTGYRRPDYAATTDPTVVATLVALCRQAEAKRVRSSRRAGSWSS